MVLKDALIAANLAGGSGGGSGGGVVTIRLGLSFDLDNGWSGEFLDDDWNSLDYADILALTNNGADVALVQYGGATSLMSYYSEDEEFYVEVYAYNQDLFFWELVSISLTSDGYNCYYSGSYTNVTVGVHIFQSSGTYYSDLSYNAIKEILNNGGYVYVISKSSGGEECVYTLDKYAYLTGSSSYITFKRISYDTYENVSRMWVTYFTMNSNGIMKGSSSYILQPNT